MERRDHCGIIEAATALLAHSPEPALLFTPDLTLLWANSAHCAMTGKPAAQIVGQAMFDAFPPQPGDSGADAADVIRASVARVTATGAADTITEQRHDLTNTAGEYEQRYWSMVHSPVFAGGELCALLQRSEDVTASVRERRLRAAERRAAEQGTGLSYFSYDPSTDAFWHGGEVATMFGYLPGEAEPRGAPFFARVHPADLPAVEAEVARAIAAGEGEPAAFDYRVCVPGEEALRHIRVRAGVERDPDTDRLTLVGVFVDMTDVQQQRIALEELSRRNAALVEEANHRIKNSLSIAAAMLAQQRRGSNDAAVRAALQTASHRIEAIAAVHAELQDDGSAAHVDAGALVERFTRSFARSLGPDQRDCVLDVEADHVILPSQSAVSLALVLNELLTNAVKYGTAPGHLCRITVRLVQEDVAARLTITNPVAANRLAEVDSSGTGTRLMEAFLRQLGGRLESERTGQGFVAEVVIPLGQGGRRREHPPSR